MVRPLARAPVRRKRAAGPVDSRHVEELEHNLASTWENLQATIERQQLSNEQLVALNDETQLINAELQSTNQELETSKEELQSVKEEMTTLNAELLAKVEELSRSQNDMKNLIDHIDIGTVFLDRQLHIRRFTHAAAGVYRLVKSDVGRLLADIKSDIEEDDLLTDARLVLETLTPCERHVRTVGGASFLARLQPYRTVDDVVEGVVLTFLDISRSVAAEADCQAARQLANDMLQTVREPLLVLDGGLTVIAASHSFHDRFDLVAADTIGCQIFALGNHQWDIPALRQLLETILPGDETFNGLLIDYNFADSGPGKLLLKARCITGEPGGPPLFLLAMEECRQAT